MYAWHQSLLGLLAAATLALVGCSSPPPTIVGEIDLQMNPSGRVPLAGLVMFTTDRPARASLTIGDDTSSMTVTPHDALVTEHELMVLGLRPGRINTVTIGLESERGATASLTRLEIEAPPLPDGFPPITVTLSRPALMEPGYTLIPINNAGNEDELGVLAAIDAQGEVVWWMEREYADQFRLQNGNLLLFYGDGRKGMTEIDMLGNVIRRWHAANIRSDEPENSIALPIDTIHHEVLELPSGNFLAISTEAREFDDYPTDVADADAPLETTTVIADVLVEFEKDGTIVRQWRMLDLIDPYRLGYNSLNPGFYSQTYADVLDEPAPDIHHGNGLSYIADEDAVVLSLKHLDAIVKLNLGENRLEWILGDPTGWREPWSELVLQPIGPVDWFYGQHAPELLPSGNVILYDNGWLGRAFPPNPQRPATERYSRAVEYEIDEQNMTVRQAWAYGNLEDERFFSVILGDADRQPQTGNILITVGGQPVDDNGQISAVPFPDTIQQSRGTLLITEVTHANPAEKVWEITIDDPAQSWTAYRADRLPSLYP